MLREVGNPYGNTVGEVCGAYAMLDEVSETLRDPSDARCRTCGLVATCLGSVVTTESVDERDISTGQVTMAPLVTCDIRKVGIAFERNGHELTGEMQLSLKSAIIGYRELQNDTSFRP